MGKLKAGQQDSRMLARRSTLLDSLKRFYDTGDHLQQLTEVLGKNPPVSLRTIDWLVTNYSKADNRYVEGCVTPVNIYIAYKAAQGSVKKKLMDPFCRRERIVFKNSEGRDFVTTLGQLNFFRWAIRNGVLKYAIDNAKDIERHMLEATAKPPQAEGAKRRTKRKELSRAANKSCTRTQIKTVIKFS